MSAQRGPEDPLPEMSDTISGLDGGFPPLPCGPCADRLGRHTAPPGPERLGHGWQCPPREWAPGAPVPNATVPELSLVPASVAHGGHV